MVHFVEELQNEADQRIARMQEAAIAAREVHATAELMRHMRSTAERASGRPRAQAVDFIVREWSEAWQVDRRCDPELASEMRRLAEAFCAYAECRDDAADAKVREAAAALDEAQRRRGTSLADQMAWRSECAHGWWELVRPRPADLPGRRVRTSVPRYVEGSAFWETGCAEHCRG